MGPPDRGMWDKGSLGDPRMQRGPGGVYGETNAIQGRFGQREYVPRDAPFQPPPVAPTCACCGGPPLNPPNPLGRFPVAERDIPVCHICEIWLEQSVWGLVNGKRMLHGLAGLPTPPNPRVRITPPR